MDQKLKDFINATGSDHTKLGSFINDPEKHLDDAGITCPDERHLVKVTIAAGVSSKLAGDDGQQSFIIAY
ncbi:hypothetical protein GC176_12300 [bacterium]|nr:hypothetical protein [bacterium]